jgi:citrate lyase beta subunit
MTYPLSDLTLLAPLLYVPADRPEIHTVLEGGHDLGVCSIAVCLEDAVRRENRQAAAVALGKALGRIEAAPRAIFIRPANLEALAYLLDHVPLKHVAGFILPKATASSIHEWIERSGGQHHILPILESREALDPIGRRELAHACAAHRPLIPCARIGANDLFALLGGLRRPSGRTVYETPVGRVIDGFLEVFSSYAVALCGPVFDRMNDLGTLAREVAEDIHRGMFAKTAINPRQIPIIWNAYRPDAQDVEEAQRILEPEAPAVFGLHGNMLERACHAEWAKRLLHREAVHAKVLTPEVSPREH